MECPFCDLNNERTRILSETENTIVIFSNPSLVKGHLLIIPKRHIEKISELNKNERTEIFEQIIKFEEILLKKFKGCDIRQNFRPFQEQNNLKINHLHFHLQPREFEDKLYKDCQVFEKSLFRMLTPEELDKIKEEYFE